MPTNLGSPSILHPVSVLTFPCTIRARLAQATVRVLLLRNAATLAIGRSAMTQMLPVCRAPTTTDELLSQAKVRIQDVATEQSRPDPHRL